MLTNCLEECFEQNEYFQKMLELFKTKPEGIFEKHHIVPRSFFRAKNMEVIDEDNLVNLSPYNHYLAHYYAWKCAKPLIKLEMAEAFLLMKKILTKTVLEEQAEEYQKAKKYILEKTAKKIVCLETGTVYNSSREASNLLNIDRKSLRNVLNGKAHTVSGLHFSYYEKELSEGERKQMILDNEKTRNIKRIICLETSTVYSSIAEASRKLNLNRISIVNCLKKRQMSAEGKHFSYYEKELSEEDIKKNIEKAERNRKVQVFNKRKRLFNVELNKEYSSIAEALKELGKPDNGRFNKRLRETDFVYGYHWRLI